VAAVGVAASQIRQEDVSPPPTTAVTPGMSASPAVQLSPNSPTVVFRPAEPGWRLMFFRRDRWVEDDHTTFGLLHDDGRYFTLAIYPTGSRTPGSALRADERLTVRGQPAFATDEGPPRYRLDWDEAGAQWEVDGTPFASLAAFAATMEGFAVVDRATWESWMPPEVVTALREHPDETITWRYGQGVETRPTVPGGAPR
jgi:hypothetical protein